MSIMVVIHFSLKDLRLLPFLQSNYWNLLLQIGWVSQTQPKFIRTRVFISVFNDFAYDIQSVQFLYIFWDILVVIITRALLFSQILATFFWYVLQFLSYHQEFQILSYYCNICILLTILVLHFFLCKIKWHACLIKSESYTYIHIITGALA